MGKPSSHKPVKLVCSIIYRQEKDLKRAEGELLPVFGQIEPIVKTIDFDFTDYYCSEMGRPLERKLLCFKALVPVEGIQKVKLATNRIEERLGAEGKRTVNIDPGYLTEAKLVLLTTKDYNHRIYIGDGIFAESTLFYMDRAFCCWPWTYPDYASAGIRGYFESVRERYMVDVKK
jgi:hypothetical protein